MPTLIIHSVLAWKESRTSWCYEAITDDTFYNSRNWLLDLVKLKKIQKFEKNSDWPDKTHTPHLSIFLETYTAKKQHKKAPNFQTKKTNPSWGLSHPPTSEFFSNFWIFF